MVLASKLTDLLQPSYKVSIIIVRDGSKNVFPGWRKLALMNPGRTIGRLGVCAAERKELGLIGI